MGRLSKWAQSQRSLQNREVGTEMSDGGRSRSDVVHKPRRHSNGGEGKNVDSPLGLQKEHAALPHFDSNFQNCKRVYFKPLTLRYVLWQKRSLIYSLVGHYPHLEKHLLEMLV